MSGWTDDRIDQLRTLWAVGHSTAEIGRRMGISKCAVIGKANRLGLVARPSPIYPSPSPRAPVIPRARKITLPIVHPSAFAHAGGLRHGETDLRADIPIVRRPSPGPIAPPRTCQWPFGFPRAPDFRFCDSADVVPGRPYCAEHCAIAYPRLAAVRADASDAREGD